MLTNLEYYKVFYNVARTQSLTLAAKALNVSQPAVSQAIRALEASLGVKLFSRVQRGVELTKEGRTLYEYVMEGYQAFENGETAIENMQNLNTGEIVIGASDMTLRFFLLPYLETFHEMYPGIKIRVTNATTPETINNLTSKKIDFGVVTTPFKADERINILNVREISDTFVGGRRYIRYKNRTLDFKELETLPIIALEGETASGRYMDEFLKNKNVTINPEFLLATSDMIVQFALKNLGVGCVMRDFAKPFIDDGTLFEFRFVGMIPKRQMCLITDRTRQRSKATDKFLELLTSKDTEKYD